MPTTQWRTETRNGGELWFIIGLAELGFRIDDDGRASGAFLAAAAPFGGIVGGWPALAKGDPGFPPTLELNSFVELDADDPTPASAALNLLVPATEISGPVFGLDLVLHRGATGEAGTVELDPSDYGTAALGKVMAVAAGLETFELVYPKYGGLHFPASISSAPGGSTAEYTMGVISIAAGVYNNDWRPDPRGNAVIVGSNSDVRVDLIVRLNDETGGAIVGRGCGQVAAKWQPNIIAYPETGTGIVPAGDAATLYFRTKKISGSGTYGASNSDARFSMIAHPVP